MREPEPLSIKESDLSNAPIRVGIVLSEDELSSITIKTSTTAIKVSPELELAPLTTYTVSAENSVVTLSDSDGNILLSAELVTLKPLSSTFPDSTLSITPIIAGRSFHWKKEITASFPGDFEFSAQGNSLQAVNTLPYEEYLACVVVSEMSSGTPIEFIKAQTVAARSWAKCFLNEKHPGEPYELCNDDDCQRYHGVTFADQDSLSASLATLGEYLVTSDGYVVAGYYSKSCGGITESPEECFGFKVQGLRSVTDGAVEASASDIEAWVSLTHTTGKHLHCGGDKQRLESFLGGVDDVGEYFRWDHVEAKTDLAKYLNEKSEVEGAVRVTSLTPLQRGPSGRIDQLRFTYETASGELQNYTATSQYEIRTLLHPSFLYSSAVTLTDDGENFHFRGAGWGHGVGLCQIGATFQAIEGKKYQEILKLYFPEAVLKKIY